MQCFTGRFFNGVTRLLTAAVPAANVPHPAPKDNRCAAKADMRDDEFFLRLVCHPNNGRNCCYFLCTVGDQKNCAARMRLLYSVSRIL